MKIALTGATGLLGGVLVPKLLARGDEVRALVRPRPGRELEDKPGLEWISGRLDEREPLERLVEGADAVIHGAYLHPEEPTETGWSVAETYVQSNFVSTMRLLEAVPGLGAKQLIYTSTLAVFGFDPDADPRGERFVRDEDFPLWPTQFYGAMRAAAEKMLIASAHCYELNTSSFRLGCVLGNRANLDEIVITKVVREAFEHGEIRTKLGAYVIDVEDSADILIQAIGDPTVQGRVYNTFDHWVDFGSLAPLLSELAGKNVKVTCGTALEPRSPIVGKAIHDRYTDFRTAPKLEGLVRRIATRVQAGE